MIKDEKVFIKAILAGIYIGVAGIIYLIMCNSNLANGKLIGAVLFSIALLVICNREYYLYTGKVGYLIPLKKEQFKVIGLTIVGNLLGIIIITLMAQISGIENLSVYANKASAIKLDKSWFEAIGSAFFCGILMYTAVDGYKNIKSDFGKTIIIIFSVVLFILAGFEHSIANMFYFSATLDYSFKMVTYIILMLIGNALGAVLVNGLHLLISNNKGEN